MPSSPPPSLARTGLRAGTAFGVSAIKSAALAFVLGGGVFFFYLSRLSGPGMPAARAGGAGAVIAMIASPPLLIALLLFAFLPLYLMLGFVRARARAMQQVARAHGDAIAQRLGHAIAARIEAMPRTHGALQRASDWLSVDALCRQLAPLLGDGRVVRGVVGFVLGRLPLSDVLAEWQQGRAGREATAPGTEDPALRALLVGRVGDTLQEFATPTRRPFYLAMSVQAVLLAVGLWLTG